MSEAGSQIYMFLLRGSDFWKSNTLGLAALNPLSLVKNIVRGDSLDLPFTSFINVHEVDHEIHFHHEEDQAEYEQFHPPARNLLRGQRTASVHDAIFRWDTARHHAPAPPAPTVGRWTGKRRQPVPGTIFGHLPTHNTFCFTKGIDSATPQLAFGCSAQEKFPLAAFYFRRRIGPGIHGIRMPYLVVGLRRVMISAWGIKGSDHEHVELRYEKICWFAMSQVGDADAPQGVSIRYWDRDRSSGGEAGMNWATLLSSLTTALVLGAGGVVAATDPGT